MRKLVIVVTGLAVLVFVNVIVFQRERLLEHGRVVRLELAPVDPRSLVQGDYMALEFAVARDATLQVRTLRSTNGALVLALDDRGVGRFVRRDYGSALAPTEARLRYRLRNDRVRLGTDAWFFEEGQADAFAAARYGEFRVADDGEALLARMLDDKLQPLGGPPKD